MRKNKIVQRNPQLRSAGFQILTQLIANRNNMAVSHMLLLTNHKLHKLFLQTLGTKLLWIDVDAKRVVGSCNFYEPRQVESLDRLYRPRDIVNDYVPTPMPRHLGGVLTD